MRHDRTERLSARHLAGSPRHHRRRNGVLMHGAAPRGRETLLVCSVAAHALDGSLIRGVNTLRFASTLAILVGGGVPLLTALSSSVRVMTNVVMREAIERAIEGCAKARACDDPAHGRSGSHDRARYPASNHRDQPVGSLKYRGNWNCAGLANSGATLPQFLCALAYRLYAMRGSGYPSIH